MFAQLSTRKRPIPSNSRDEVKTNARDHSKSLKGAVVCLTGFDLDEKERLHLMVEKLGGR